MNEGTEVNPDFVFVESGTAIFDETVALWGRNRRWLGLFPEGAFTDYASRQGLLAAIGSGGEFLGYVAFRHTRGWTHIVHLCVHPRALRQGVARALVQHLSAISERSQQAGIRLKCRRDFPATEFWRKTGFVARGEARGRGKDPKSLTIWIRRHECCPDLFSDIESDRLVAVLDANAFYDLEHEDKDPERVPAEAQQTLYLCPGWVQESVELCVVDELFNEIDRNAFPETRQEHRSRAGRYRELSFDGAESERAYEILQEILGWRNPRPQQRSDMWQIAKAAASGADFFITRDQRLLNAAEEIAEKLDIQLTTPADLVVGIDQQERRHLYAPARLAGTSIQSRKPGTPDFDAQIEEFRLHDLQEPGKELLARLRTFAAASTGCTGSHTLKILENREGRAIALYGWRHDEAGNVLIEFLRGTRHRVARTAIRHLLLACIEKAAELGGTKVAFADKRISPQTAQALAECGFLQDGAGWTRLLVPLIAKPAQLPALIRPNAAPPNSPAAVLDLESRYWPLKITGVGVPCCLVPIKRHWAAELFDHSLAAESLFPADPLRVLSRNNVYYRSAIPRGPEPPARLLWYVSGTKTIRAASRLIHRQTGAAKSLFHAYKHLGAYDWPDILRLAAGDPERPIEVLEFSDTERFANPVPVSTLQELGSGRMLQGPSRLPEDHFMVAYAAGTNRLLP